LSEDPQRLPDWKLAIAKMIALRSEDGDITYNDIIGEELDTVQVAEFLVVMGEVAVAAAAIRRAVTDELARRMASEEITAIEAAGVLVTWKPKKTTRVVDIDGFWSYMRANPHLLEPGFNPNSLRKTGIPASVFDTFFEEVPGVEPVISEIPMFVVERNRNKKEIIDADA